VASILHPTATQNYNKDMKVRNADSVLRMTCFSKKHTTSCIIIEIPAPATEDVMHSRNLEQKNVSSCGTWCLIPVTFDQEKNRKYEEGKKLNVLVTKCLKLHEKL